MNQEEQEIQENKIEDLRNNEEFQQFCDHVQQIQENLNEYITKQSGNQSEENQRLHLQLQENFEIIKQKIAALRRCEVVEDQEELKKMIDEVTKIVQQTNEPFQQIQYEGDDFNGLELEFTQPKRIKGLKNAQERKQERKRARIQKSKQAFQIFKKYIIVSLIAFQKFIKDPENIAKLFVIAVSCFFVSSFLQIPDMSKRHSLYILEWLAYNRCARVVLISGSFCFVSLTWYIILLIWIGFMGLNETKGKLNTLIHECNPILQLTLMFMTDNDLINNKLDLAIWFCYLFQYSTYRVYYIHSVNIIKKILSTLTSQNFNRVYQFQQIYIFSLIILAMNFLITFFGILMLHKVGIYALSLLFYGGVQTFIEYSQLILICKKLQQKYTYFINNNIEQLTEPQFYEEIIPDILYQIVKFLNSSQLIVNYFRTINFHIFLHLWLFQIFSDLQSSLSSLKKNIDQLIKYKRIQQHLDSLFPRVLDIQEDEICIICHEELILARSLPCQHKFHLKCLFGWLKAQQQCPICRAEVPIELEQPQQIFSKILSFLTQFNISNFAFLFYVNSGRQQDLQLTEWEEQALLGQELLQQQQQLQQQQRDQEQMQQLQQERQQLQQQLQYQQQFLQQQQILLQQQQYQQQQQQTQDQKQISEITENPENVIKQNPGQESQEDKQFIQDAFEKRDPIVQYNQEQEEKEKVDQEEGEQNREQQIEQEGDQDKDQEGDQNQEQKQEGDQDKEQKQEGDQDKEQKYEGDQDKEQKQEGDQDKELKGEQNEEQNQLKENQEEQQLINQNKELEKQQEVKVFENQSQETEQIIQKEIENVDFTE
ncbi:unnamed protein product (macronuclear) [Paramecium tetraurelia]|uniref:RING-type domain-containing protein n=1 Tax=Paramecium tetraurelia TaxID=5888 RepID=A0DYB6_PARTE|nr:uncharacterized protein GSPATT00003001001 [Paramecium tetraurelia]CAK88033.1 unnamed protein product [Paramecium tetraurelia]|eukprot:XP_001455430.1 hypothetical protein (macronuclear) [Paramecium tetraurelia strain d4-2]